MAQPLATESSHRVEGGNSSSTSSIRTGSAVVESTEFGPNTTITPRMAAWMRIARKMRGERSCVLHHGHEISLQSRLLHNQRRTSLPLMKTLVWVRSRLELPWTCSRDRLCGLHD